MMLKILSSILFLTSWIYLFVSKCRRNICSLKDKRPMTAMQLEINKKQSFEEELTVIKKRISLKHKLNQLLKVLLLSNLILQAINPMNIKNFPKSLRLSNLWTLSWKRQVIETPKKVFNYPYTCSIYSLFFQDF